MTGKLFAGCVLVLGGMSLMGCSSQQNAGDYRVAELPTGGNMGPLYVTVPADRADWQSDAPYALTGREDRSHGPETIRPGNGDTTVVLSHAR